MSEQQQAALGPGLVSTGSEDWEQEAEIGLQNLSLSAAPASLASKNSQNLPDASHKGSRHQSGPGASTADDGALAFEGRHILELSALPASFSDAKLEALLREAAHGAQAPVTRRVDTSTLLVICADPDRAAATMHALSGQLSVRPFAQACKASRAMPVPELQPPRPRPQTSAAVANRLIGHALNNKDTRNKDVEQRLRDQKEAAAAKSKQRAEQLNAAWDD